MRSDPPDSTEAAGDPGPLPLCVDLDGTLLATDSLHELCVALAVERPGDLVRLPFWTLRGRAHLKARLAERVSLAPELLPYHEEVVDLVRETASRDRATLLVTAADQKTAEGIAAHVGGFEAVLGSDGERNLKGDAKAEALEARFGRGAFEYLGDSRADLPVWEAAGGASLVGVGPELHREVAERMPVRRALPGRTSGPGDWLGLLGGRPFVEALPLLAAGLLAGSPFPWRPLLPAFVGFAAACVALRLVDRLLDLPRARARQEPTALATGRLSILRASVVVLVLAGSVLLWTAATSGIAVAGWLALLLASGSLALGPGWVRILGRVARPVLCALAGLVASGVL